MSGSVWLFMDFAGIVSPGKAMKSMELSCPLKEGPRDNGAREAVCD